MRRAQCFFARLRLFEQSHFVFGGIGIAADRPVGVQHLPRHERTVGAGLAALDHKGHRDLRVVEGRITNEDGVVDDVFALLCRSGLGGDALGVGIIVEVFGDGARPS